MESLLHRSHPLIPGHRSVDLKAQTVYDKTRTSHDNFFW